ncbi:MAG TPA: peptidoglycan -binding protein [Geminicoccaceae bacterium]|nr:peptidoglycan -binding protein [Geminicoccaceae bacterium]
MAVRSRAGNHRAPPDIWPGFVDALSTLLMVIIFLLVVFVLAQFFLNQLLQGRDEALQRLRTTINELTTQLDLERDTVAEMRLSAAQLSADLQAAVSERDDSAALLARVQVERDELSDRLTAAQQQQALFDQTLREMRLEAEQRGQEADMARAELEELRASVTADRETIELQLAQLVSLRRDIEALQKVRDELEGSVTTLAAQLEDERGAAERLRGELTQVRDRTTQLEASLAGERERTALAQRELDEREVRLDELLRSSADLEQQLTAEQRVSAEALDQVRLLNQQINALRIQLSSLEQALELERQTTEQQSVTIADLSSQLNTALADKVQELSRFRSEFFGRLREVLGERQDVRIVGDRFVFQSEVLFDPGSAEIGDQGKEQLAKLADSLIEISEEIPSDLPWILRIDGHTDRRPINTPRFPSNWELSAARAIEVAKYLIEQGIPPERIAAAGFAQNQPLDDRDDEIAYRRNRRIEIKLTNF